MHENNYFEFEWLINKAQSRVKRLISFLFDQFCSCKSDFKTINMTSVKLIDESARLWNFRSYLKLDETRFRRKKDVSDRRFW